MKSIIVGMGIGNLYKEVLTNLGHEIVTVDLDPTKADYTSVEDAIIDHQQFDTAHICTPNFTHEPIARELAPVTKIVFIEKPGVHNTANLYDLYRTFPNTRFMMVKNNQWRDNIQELRRLASNSVNINLFWINKNRVPSPGTWFTTKELAFGGVSRDLMTHLLSLYQVLNYSYDTAKLVEASAEQRYSLADVSDTEYGTVKQDGIYNVDDVCKIVFQGAQRTWNLIADWRSNSVDERAIHFDLVDGSKERFELGLCPVEAYQAMIADAVKNIDNDVWWNKQEEYDEWIIRQVEYL